tara:strand:- start:64 stop:303 length:240 start_codon:yes stop_codon:yes gene_type:complete
MSRIDIQQGDLVIYTDQKKFVEFVGEVAIVREKENSDNDTLVTVEWMNDVTFQGHPAGLSKFCLSSFDKISANIKNWKK